MTANASSLGEHVRTLGRGPGRSRSLTQDEAADAMRLMLSGDAAPEAIGALLMLLRMKGETAWEIAGFASAAQDAVGPLPQADLDWPSYAAGRTRGAPWFLISALLVADAGYRVMLHGWNGADAQVRAGVAALGIPVAGNAADLDTALSTNRIAYAPLETLHPALFALLRLREVLHLRSCVNTVCRMLNPAKANASVQGVFHPVYRLIQADAAALLGWPSLSVIKGGGGEFERNPAKPADAFGLRDGALWQEVLPPLVADHRRMTDDSLGIPALLRAAAGEAPEFETHVILSTATLALATLGEAEPEARARALWQARQDRQAA